MLTPLLAADLSPGSVAALVFVGVVTWTLLMRAHRARNRRPDPLPSQLAKQADLAASARATKPAELEGWEVRMYDLSRELSGQLDSKLSALQHLVNTAEQRIAQLQQLLERAEQHGLHDPAGTQAERLTPQVDDANTGARPTNSRQQQIFDLADAGHDSHSIAAIVGVPVGEVALILGLRQTQRS